MLPDDFIKVLSTYFIYYSAAYGTDGRQTFLSREYAILTEILSLMHEVDLLAFTVKAYCHT